jgi:hypothetical protein
LNAIILPNNSIIIYYISRNLEYQQNLKPEEPEELEEPEEPVDPKDVFAPFGHL